MKIITQANTVTTSTGSLNRVHTDYENNRSIVQIGASTTIHINTEEAAWLIAALQDSNNRLLGQVEGSK